MFGKAHGISKGEKKKIWKQARTGTDWSRVFGGGNASNRDSSYSIAENACIETPRACRRCREWAFKGNGKQFPNRTNSPATVPERGGGTEEEEVLIDSHDRVPPGLHKHHRSQ